ncbi:four helix bundle protein [Prolixibacter sp. SD074]|uniref:four helix bundle protein n=1 Tax=Prolixibacter sp. SD074 TaxID=2652391 RepID=UPI0012994202|nr:four helix bundle protein [Prolixibacter sp. SD074]
MTEKELFIQKMKARTKRFALDIIAFCSQLPKNNVGYRIGDQLLRSGTSVGANYRASCRARSQAEFYSKISIVVEEGDESGFWLELLIESNQMGTDEAHRLLKEANEITSVMATPAHFQSALKHSTC